MIKNLTIAVLVFGGSILNEALCQGPVPVLSSDSPYPYWINLPDGYRTDSTYKWPVIVFLHGRSLSGTDLMLVKRYGLIAEVLKGRSFPAIIVAPQVPMRSSWNPDSVVKCLWLATKGYNIDSSRISITGMSLGGYGTLMTAGKFPEVFSAAAAFCGGGSTKDGCRLSQIPVWIAHGKQDEAVPFSESQKVVNSIRNCGEENLRFTIFESANHGKLERMFRTSELYDFLLTNSKGNPTYFPEFSKQSL
jgi:predicted peptidase